MWEVLYRRIDRSKEPRAPWSPFANVYLYSHDTAKAVAEMVRNDWNGYKNNCWQFAIRQVSDTAIQILSN